MAVSGSQLTRIGAAISGPAIKLTITAKAAGLPAIVYGEIARMFGVFSSTRLPGKMRAQKQTAIFRSQEQKGRFK